MGKKQEWSPIELERLPKSRGEAFQLNEIYYFTGRACARGHAMPRRAADGKCLACFREAAKRRMRRRRLEGAIEQHERRQSHGLTRSLEMMLWIVAKNRAKRAGLEFNIEVTDIIIPEKCPILGISIDRTWGGRDQKNDERANAPSLDRLNSNLGYIKGNIAVISYRANLIKGDGTSKEHRMIASCMRKSGF